MAPYLAPSGTLTGLVWHALPAFVIYPAAWWLLGRLDRSAIEARLQWVPSRRDARLLYLTLAAWLAWPLTLIEMLWRMFS